MNLNFFKYHGAGNDFIIIDNRKNVIKLSEKQISFLCDRHFGIGADGLMFLLSDDNYDFRMKYYNSNGKEGTMCGNGGRCIVAFAKKMKIIGNKTKFIAVDGEHLAKINIDKTVSLKMQDLTDISKINTDFFLNTGSPHYVSFVDDINKIDVYNEGKKIRYNKTLTGENGANVNFAQIVNNKIIAATYERGVENETLSCGTGVTAVAISASLKINKNNFDIETKGGKLNVKFNKKNNTFNDIWLTGPAQYVFKGEIEI